MLAAGGTGGHMVPAHVVAAELRARGHAVHLVTDERGMRFPGLFEGVPHTRVASASIGGLAGLPSALARIWAGRKQAIRLFRELKPAAVLGFGGYPALPSLLAAGALRFPAAIHEQNAVLGRVNKLMARRVQAVATSFPAVRGAPADAVLVGNPVRADVIAIGQRPYPSTDGDLELAVIGGSQGASILSRVLPAAIGLLPDALRARLHVTQQCRPEDLASVRAEYDRQGTRATLESYFGDFPARLAAAHLVVARSGASTMAELAAAGRPAVLVPFAAATDDHQAANAREFVSAGGGPMLREAAFTPEAAADALTKLLADPAALARAAAGALSVGRPDAGRRLADLAESLSR